MQAVPLAHPIERKAVEVFESDWLTDEAKSLRTPDLSAGDFLLALTSRHLYRDAIQSLVYAMPNRLAIWWLCQCLWQLKDQWSALDRAALQAAVDWVVYPTEERVARAASAADTASFESPSRCAANAVLWAGAGPIVDEQVNSRPQRLAAQLVGGGLSLVQVLATKGSVALSPRQILGLGFDVVHGVSRWDTILAWHAMTNQRSATHVQGSGP